MALLPRVISNTGASGAQVIDGSLRFEGSKTTFLQRSQSGGNRRTFTWSGWIKPDGSYTGTNNNDWFTASEGNTTGGIDYGFGVRIYETSHGSHANQLMIYEYENSNFKLRYISTQTFRDYSGFYHLVVAVDTTLASSTDRIKAYVNGERVTNWKSGFADAPTQNLELTVNESGKDAQIGVAYDSGSGYIQQCDGYANNFYVIDGQQLEPTYFAYTDPLTNTWRPKKYDGATTTSFMWPLASTVVDTFNAVSFTENGGSTSFTSAGTNSFGLSDCADYGAGGKYLSYAIYPATKWTIDFYVKFDDVTSGSNSYVAGWNGTGGSNCCFGIRKSDSIMGVWGSSNLYSSTVAAVDTWYQIRMTTSGSSDLKLYINGTLSATDAGSDQDPATPLTFGDIQSGRFDGQLAGIRYVPDDLGAPTAGGEVSTGGLLPNVKTIGVNYGINGVHLPLDGNSPIGRDQSGNGNEWIPYNLGAGTVSMDKATGAFPTLNTINGGTIATPGVRGQVSIAVTVAPKTGGGDAYYLNGVEAPSLEQYRGQTITFDQEDSTNDNHPLKIATAADAAGSTEYETGVLIGGTPGITTYYGVDFDGDSNRMRIPESSEEFKLQSDFTVEGWVYVDAFTSDCAVFSFWDTGATNTRNLIIGPNASGSSNWEFIYNSSGSGSWTSVANPDAWTGKWTHIAYSYTHSGTTHRAFVDGVLVGTNSASAIYDNPSSPFIIGCNTYTNTGFFNGKVTNVRFSNSVRYTDNFQPQVEPFATDGNTVFLGCLSGTSVTTAVTTPSTPETSDAPSVWKVDNLYNTSTKITIPNDAPNTLYYYCGNHSGMGGSIGVSTDLHIADPHASKCVVALPLAGVSEDVSASVACTSIPKKVTDEGDATSTRVTAPFYGSSYDFDGSGDHIAVTSPVGFGTVFCQEAWIYHEGGGDYILTSSSASGSASNYSYIESQTAGELRIKSDPGASADTPARFYAEDQWFHVAHTSDGITGKIYVNGQLSPNTYSANGWTPGKFQYLRLAGGGGFGGDYTGQISDYRCYVGTTKYTGNFNPPSISAYILPDTPSGAAYGSELMKITDGAVVFDGSGDYLSGSSTDTFLSDAKYTIDGFIYLNSIPSSSATEVIFDTGSGGSDPELNVYNNSGNVQLYESLSNNTNWDAGAPYMKVGRWYYFKQTVNGTSATDSSAIHKLYIDGKVGVSNTINLSSRSASSAFSIGARTDASLELDAFISNLRYRSVVDDSLIVPTSPLTNSTGTQLLCCQSNTSAGAAAVAPNLGGVNNGTVWSDGVTLPTSSVTGAATNLFDGDITTFVQTTNTSEWVEVNLGSVSFSTSFELYGSSSYDQDYQFDHAGGTYSWTGNFGGNAWLDFASSLTSPVTAFRYKDSGGTGSASIAAVRVDSVILTDPLSPLGDAAATNFNPFNTDIDTVLGKSTGYATWNPLQNSSLRGGNLVTNGTGNFYSTIVIPQTGSWYWEVTANDSSYIGIDNRGQDGTKYIHYNKDGQKQITGGSTSSYGSSFTTSDLIGVAFDASNMTIRWYKNGVDQGEVNVGSGGVVDLRDLDLQCQFYTDSSNESFTNFGQKPFKFPPPERFQPLNVANLELPQFARSSNVVGVSTWLGTSDDNHTINTGFQADLLWYKDRDTTANWYCFDSVRGRTQVFHPNLTNAESGPENNIIRNLSNKSGYILGQAGDGNNSSYNYVGYSWKAGGNAGTFNKDGLDAGSAAAAGVSDGSITPTACSVGTREGFSIIKYTSNNSSGATVGHGLAATPQLIMIKNTEDSNNWHVYHEGMGNTKFLYLDLNYAADTSSTIWNDTSPTNTVFTLGNGNGVNNASSNAYMAYCWCNKTGLQKFGSYQGNGSATDGTYVDLGFKPALLITKKFSSTSNWIVWDKERSPYNVCNAYLYVNDTDTEDTDGANGVDFLSNGFKMYNNYTDANNSGADYIYMAWAESPLHNLYGDQATAR